MKVSWFAPSYEECNGVITKYEVMYKENAGNEQFLQTKGLSKDITGLKDGGQYQLAVRAYTKVGPGPYSSYQTFFTGKQPIISIECPTVIFKILCKLDHMLVHQKSNL